jgi:hypothetical protein
MIRPNTGLIWHTAVHPSVHASYDNISHLFPLLLISHVVTYIVLIKGGASERCDFSQFGKRQFSNGTCILVFLSLPTSWFYFYSPGFRRVTLLSSPSTTNAYIKSYD